MGLTTGSAEATADRVSAGRRGFFTGRRGKRRREALLAYVLLFPALSIIFTFGIFPLAFALFESSRKGLNKIVGKYDGLGNYVKAVDNLAYVIAFWLSIAFLVLAFRMLLEMRRNATKEGDVHRPWLIPGALMGSSLAALGRFVFSLLPEALSIPDKVERGQELTRELFLQLFGEAMRIDAVMTSLQTGVFLLTLALLAYYLVTRYAVVNRRSGGYFAGYVQASVLVILALALAWLTWTEIELAYAAAMEGGETLAIWPQVVTISAGIVLLGLSWLLWRSANFRQSNISMFLRMGAAITLAIGAWVLIGELPLAVAAGNKDWWQGLRATVFYSVGSIPLQLGISLLLATFMFQNIKGTTFWRMIYFLPYIAPLVGTAAAFRLIFSGRPKGPINLLLGSLGIESLGWLNESDGIFQMLVGSNFDLSGWLAGPSLALGVIILYGVWSFVGFNIVIFLAGLGNIPTSLYEAASIDGGGRWAQFRHITLPMLSPSIYFLVLLSVIGTFKAFTHIWVLRFPTALGSTDTASVVIFQAFNRDTRYGYASALAILLLIIVVILTTINNRIASKRVFYG